MHQRRTASVISFLSTEGVKPIEIHQQMKVQYGKACLSLQQVYESTRKFMNGISSVTDSPRPGARVAALSAKRIFSRGIHALPSPGTLV
jgi:predicted nuclease with RNAse H fold